MKKAFVAAFLIPTALFALSLFLYSTYSTPAGQVLSSSTKPTPNTDLLIIHAQVVTLNQSSDILEDAWISIDNGIIQNISEGEVNPHIIPAQTINAQGKLVLPGLVNLHTHLGMSSLRNKVPADLLPQWLETLNHLERKLTPEDIYQGSLLAIKEAQNYGTTALNDMYFYPEATAQAAADAGQRVWIRLPLVVTNNTVGIDQNYALNDSPLISYVLAPNPLTSYTLDQLTQIAQLALKRNIPVHIHFESDATEKNEFKKNYNLTPLQTLIETGLINTRLLLAHSIFLTDKEIEQLAIYKNITVVTTPRSELRLGTPITPVVKLLEHNIGVAFGTDGVVSSGNLNMFEDIRLAALQSQPCTNSRYCESSLELKPELLLRMATLGAAEALGQEQNLGSIESGKQADLLLLNTHQTFTSDKEIYTWLVYSASGKNIDQTLIQGKVVYKK